MSTPEHIRSLIGDGDRPEGWTVEQEDAMLAPPGTPPGPLTAEQVAQVVAELRAMDLQQQQTDERGQRELAWYYWRDGVERLLGLDAGALDMQAYVTPVQRRRQ